MKIKGITSMALLPGAAKLRNGKMRMRSKGTCVAAAVLLFGLVSTGTAQALPTSSTTVTIRGTTITTSPTTGAVPLTASGCNYNVCVRVIGSGLTVSEIEVWTYNNACLPVGTEVTYNYGPTTREPAWQWQYVTPTVGGCTIGKTWQAGVNLDVPSGGWSNKYWICGTISDEPGEPCEQLLS